MKKQLFIIILLINFIYPSLCFAKRVYVDYPDEISINGIIYKTSYSEGLIFHKAYIKAFETKSGQTLWERKIYSTFQNPFLEHDIQWIFIKSVIFKNDKLIIENEKNIKYVLDLNTLKVSK